MVLPEPPLAPVIPPVTVPIVHTNVLGAVAVKPIAVDVPLQILAVFVVVTDGVGLTVTVMVYVTPGHDPVLEVGVIKY